MIQKADISLFYDDPQKALEEEKAWAINKPHENYARFLGAPVNEHKIYSILELCCGSGFLPRYLPRYIRYLGIDNNEQFIAWAKAKNTMDREFIRSDIRKITPATLATRGHDPFGLVCMFAAVKHFGLHEFNDIIKHMLSFAPVAMFDVQMLASGELCDNGDTFHHTYITPRVLHNSVLDAGHKIVSVYNMYQGDSYAGPMYEQMVYTVRA